MPGLISPALTAEGWRTLHAVVKAHPPPWNLTTSSIVDASGRTVVLMDGTEPARALLLRIIVDTVNLTFHVVAPGTGGAAR